ncbi:60S ribosomal protein L6-B [Eremomyces bilateralis CBS 781.70]|uniref:60S ribosomal protein L6-B n=1 Tax=Eremomyces bilateralis CBS 781.70 TaxID=1392243 RepID=A0A6G1GGR3_9PEZI|nr:60S ribosomal protein L6-B [Eremomyces bilateralis CBS 781.70]KAF1817243.1 60S ribosomal protein L6-B [Eremomyces bilateralis CBS 781.70]
MSATQEQPTTKKFGKGERTIPAASQKASKYYPTDDDPKPKQVRKTIRPTKLRQSLQPGTVLILLAGRFRGKRVVLLKHLGQGVLLVTGPFKVNGVPLRRVNARYVIATQTRVDLKGVVDEKVLEKVSVEGYFTADKESNKAGEDAFFKQGEKPAPKQVSSGRAEDQKAVDQKLLAALKKTPMLIDLLGSTFSLRKGDRPHEMVF